jgi:DNA-binding transcriptional LysR family regulator
MAAFPAMSGIEDLRTFCMAADLGSIGRAAARLHVSQPALSKRLHALEARAGAELLRRTPHGVELTPAGQALYPEAQRLLAQAAVVDDVLAGLGRRAPGVRVAASHTIAETVLTGALEDAEDERPLALELIVANSDVVRSLVAAGDAEVGVAAVHHGAATPELREEHLIDDEIVVAVPLHHPWARLQRVSLREFLRTPMVVRDRGADSRVTVDEVLRERGLVAAAPLCEASTTVAARQEARIRNAPILLSCSALTGHGLARVEVGGLSFRRAFAVVLPARGEPTAGARAFVQRLRAAVASREVLTPEALPGWRPGTSGPATSAPDAAPTT